MPDWFVKRTRIPAPVERVFAWHEAPGALEKLTPPWEPVTVVERHGSIRDGDRTVLRVGPRPFRLTWVAEHRGYIPNRQFRDVQVRGPFARWEHTHAFEPDGPGGCFLEDRIEYELPFGWLGRVLGGAFTRRKLERMFAYRHAVTLRELAGGGENKV